MLFIHLFCYSNLITARNVILSSFLSCSPVGGYFRTGSLCFGELYGMEGQVPDALVCDRGNVLLCCVR